MSDLCECPISRGEDVEKSREDSSGKHRRCGQKRSNQKMRQSRNALSTCTSTCTSRSEEKKKPSDEWRRFITAVILLKRKSNRERRREETSSNHANREEKSERISQSIAKGLQRRRKHRREELPTSELTEKNGETRRNAQRTFEEKHKEQLKRSNADTRPKWRPARGD